MSNQLSQKEIWVILQSCKDLQFKPPDIEKAVLKICEKLDIEEHTDVRDILQREIKGFTGVAKMNKIQNKDPHNYGSDAIIIKKGDYIKDESEVLHVEPTQSKRKKF